MRVPREPLMRIVAPESGSAARCAAKSSDVAKKRRVGAAAGAEAGIEEAGGKIFAIVLIFATFVVLVRELAVTSLRLLAKNADGKVIAANMAGKIKTVSQIIFIIAALVEPLFVGFYPMNFLFITYLSLAIMVYMTIYSGIKYFMIYIPMLKN